MKARLRVGSAGPVLPTSGLQVSAEVGGAGSISFEAKSADLVSTGAKVSSAVIILEIETSAGVWTPAFPYVLRPPYVRRKVGVPLEQCSGVALLESWASSTIFYPEYNTDVILPLAGQERGLGWMNSAYDWANDPREPWDKCYHVSRSARPAGWPEGSGAEWISATGATEQSERKLFRSSITVPDAGGDGSSQLVRFYLSSDESAQLWVGAEKVLEFTETEFGRKTTYHVDVGLKPGTYAVGIDTMTVISKGGDGVDPVIMCAALVDDEGDPASWLKHTSNAWGACRRDDEGEGSDPPGPTPGQIIIDLVGEASARGVCGWSGVTFGFTTTHDSYGASWATATERLVRNGMDDYWQFFQALGETEADIWMTPGLVLHAAKKQGQARMITWTENEIGTMSDQLTEDYGTVAMGLTHQGWVQGSEPGWRREVALELGQCLSLTVGLKVVFAALDEVGRWDGSVGVYKPGPIPFLDFGPGDWGTLTYRDLNRLVRVLSIAAQAGEGGLLWSLELSNDVEA